MLFKNTAHTSARVRTIVRKVVSMIVQMGVTHLAVTSHLDTVTPNGRYYGNNYIYQVVFFLQYHHQVDWCDHTYYAK